MKDLLCIAALAACKSSAQPAAPAADEPPPMCAGQQAAPAPDTPHAGPMEMQLAPAFLDKMPACRASDATIPGELVDGAAGAVDDKGDCVWPSGVVCHFHLGAEFVHSNVPRPHLAELHCIFPVASDAKSPKVFGTRFTCKASTALQASTEETRAAACGAGILSALAAMTASCDTRCCDDGTLTDTVEARRTMGALDVRPDFRICAAPAELDCGALATMIGHSANAPIYGPPIESKF